MRIVMQTVVRAIVIFVGLLFILPPLFWVIGFVYNVVGYLAGSYTWWPKYWGF